MKKKVLVFLVVLSMLSMLITACKETSSTEDDDVKTPTSQEVKGETTQTENATEKQWPEPNVMPISEKKIELRMFAPLSNLTAQFAGELKNLQAFRDYENTTNVAIKFETVPQGDYGQAVNLMFASGNLADMVSVNDDLVEQYGVDDDLLVPIDDLLDQYGYNWNKWKDALPGIEKQVRRSNGKIYLIPSIGPEDATNVVWGYLVRQEWIDNLGLKYPGTVDEFYDLLVSFRDNDPAGDGKTIPFAVVDKYHLDQLFGIWGTNPGFYQVDGVAKYGPLTDEFKIGLEFLAKLYSERLLDQDYALSSESAYNSNIVKNIGATFAGSATFQGPLIQAGIDGVTEKGGSKANEVFYPLIPIKGPDGKYYDFMSRTDHIIKTYMMIAITSSNKYPVESVKWLDNCLSFEGTMNLRFGPKGYLWDISEEGFPMYHQDDLRKPTLAKVMGYALGFNNLLPTLRNVYIHHTFPYTPEDVLKMPHRIHGYLPNDLYTNNGKNYLQADRSRFLPLDFKLTTEEQKELQNIHTDINTYYEENVDKIIMGVEPLSKWDEVVSQIKKMDIDKAIKIYQDALDRTK